MPDLKRTRNRLKFAIAALVLLDAAAVAMLVTPIAGMREARQQEMRQEWQQLKAREFAPWRGLDKKLPAPNSRSKSFIGPLPDRGIFDLNSLGSVSAASGVRISGVKYTVKECSPLKA